jgi:hypothetical protein
LNPTPSIAIGMGTGIGTATPKALAEQTSKKEELMNLDPIPEEEVVEIDGKVQSLQEFIHHSDVSTTSLALAMVHSKMVQEEDSGGVIRGLDGGAPLKMSKVCCVVVWCVASLHRIACLHQAPCIAMKNSPTSRLFLLHGTHTRSLKHMCARSGVRGIDEASEITGEGTGRLGCQLVRDSVGRGQEKHTPD